MESIAKPDSPQAGSEDKAARITVRCSKSLKKAAQWRAVQDERTLEEICVEALARYLSGSAAA